MAPRTTIELIDITKRSESTYPVGAMIEVMYDMPDLQRRVAYIGTVAVRPETKAQQTVITNKYGPERILPMAATYTLTTLSKTIHKYVETDDGLELMQSTDSPYIADLIFDPTSPAFSVKPASEIVPQPQI